MRIFLLGDADDAAGFALAGVEGAVCRARLEIEEALRRLSGAPEVPDLLLVSDSVARLAAPALDRLAASERAPRVLRLPESPEPSRPAGNPT